MEIAEPAICRHTIRSRSTQRMGSGVGRSNIEKGSEPRARSVRVTHTACKRLAGARFTVSSDHRRRKKRDETFQRLSVFANGAEIHVMRRTLRIPRGETEPGMPWPYDRTFWLKEPNLHMKRPAYAMAKARLNASNQGSKTLHPHSVYARWYCCSRQLADKNRPKIT